MSQTNGPVRAAGGTRVRRSAWIAGAAGAAALVAGLQLIGTLRRGGVTAGVLLLVVALGLTALAVGGGSYGPEREGRLDLSTRIAAGVLGGALGGVAHLVVAWSIDLAGLPGLLGVELTVWLTPGELASETRSGAVWGLLFGAAYRFLPGRGPVARGLFFSAAPALWTLLVVFPDLKFGLFGVELGVLTFVVVAIHHLVWGGVAGAVLRWAERTDLAPLSRPLGA